MAPNFLRDTNCNFIERKRFSLIFFSLQTALSNADWMRALIRANKVEKTTYVMDGSGEPPMLLHVKSSFLSSVAVAMLPGATMGGCGGVNIVIL